LLTSFRRPIRHTSESQAFPLSPICPPQRKVKAYSLFKGPKAVFSMQPSLRRQEDADASETNPQQTGVFKDRRCKDGHTAPKISY